MSIELTGEEMHKMSVLELKEFYEENNLNSFKESDDIGVPERGPIYLEGLRMSGDY